MSALDAVKALNLEAKHWRLNVGRRDAEVMFYVSGEVLPEGRKRGARYFDCGATPDAREALVRGAASMRRQKEWPA